jgi:adenylate cyclase
MGEAAMPTRCEPAMTTRGEGTLPTLRRFVLGSAGGMAPPARTRAAIAEAEAEAEILVGWTQIGAILGFGLLYAISPKAFPPDVPFEPVPWALGAYALFTLLRLGLAYRHKLKGPFLAASVVIDMAVLMVTIWSFHLQYGAPPGLYVKAPTLMYVFILIALRALRFEARWVLLAGGTAIAGWFALVAYAVLVHPGGLQVTRNYAEYMTSYRILIGAEIDKLVSIGMVAVVLAVAVTRARSMLVAATTERLAGQELSRFFAPEVAATIKGAEMAIAPGDGEVREAAILFVDLRGFTRLATTLSPRAVMTLLGEYQERFVPVIRRHGGSIDKFLGDGILASFGATRASPSHAADALRAVEAMLAEAERWAQARRARGEAPLRIGLGVAAGTVMFGAVGHSERLEYTVIGDPVNLAAKLEAHTKALGVGALATAETLAAAERQGYRPALPVRRLAAAAVGGTGRSIDLAVLEAPAMT